MGPISQTFIRPWLSLFLSVCTVGCTSSQIIQVGDKLDPSNQTIRVRLKDQRSISFWPEKYTVNPETDSTYITGSGLEKHPTTWRESKFEGSIAYQEIEQIEVVEKTTFTKIMVPVGLTITGLVVLLVVVFTISPPEIY